MAFDWEHVEAIRAEQDSARNRRDLNTLPTDEVSNEIYNSPSGRNAKIPGLDHWEQMIHKVRTQLIDYIIEHGLVQGFEYDGINEPIKNGKIVITAEMLQRVTDRFGYFKEKETLEFIEKYLPEHHYVADEGYVHTDNNYTNAEKIKLDGIEDGAEVNKVISVLFNGVEAINPETQVATITITPADVKAWYEQNPDTNVFTDAEKAKLKSINLDELSNKVEDVTLDGETVVKNKVAVLTAKKIKDSYESNADTNAFTDADKALVEHVLPEVQKGVNQHEQRIDALEKSQITQDTEINDAKNSITELGNEVNSVAGRVTTLETSQRVQDADILQLKEDVKNAGKVDDVTVGGVSVVENKVAKIPAIPNADAFVPYENATKDVDIGDHSLVVKAIGSSSDLPISSEIRVGKTIDPETEALIPGISISTELTRTFNELAIRSTLDAKANYNGLFASVESEHGSEFESTQYQLSASGFSVGSPEAYLPTVIRPGVIRGLDLPKTNDSAASKEYVDLLAEKVLNVQLTSGNIPKGSSLTLTTPITIPTSPVDGYIPVIRSLTIVDKGSTPESMIYNYGLDKNNKIFITYFNNDTTASKTPTTKSVIVCYAYEKSNA